MTCAQLGQKSMHVVRVTDYGVNEDDVPFYVMEYLKGENIGRLVHKKSAASSSLFGFGAADFARVKNGSQRHFAQGRSCSDYS